MQELKMYSAIYEMNRGLAKRGYSGLHRIKWQFIKYLAVKSHNRAFLRPNMKQYQVTYAAKTQVNLFKSPPPGGGGGTPLILLRG